MNFAEWRGKAIVSSGEREPQRGGVSKPMRRNNFSADLALKADIKVEIEVMRAENESLRRMNRDQEVEIQDYKVLVERLEQLVVRLSKQAGVMKLQEKEERRVITRKS